MDMLPRFVALCGLPKSGKSTVQEILANQYFYEPVDDGWPLRDFAMQNLGLSRADVTTQEGKAQELDINGRTMKVREFLGELGNALEAKFGDDILPWLATQPILVEDGERYSFGSVRKTQGKFYKSIGGIVIGIERPGLEGTGFNFDDFDRSIVDYWIINDGSLDDLSRNVRNLFDNLFTGKK